MADIQPGYTYGDAPNNVINAQNLNEHVANATILPAFISSKTLKSPAALSDKHVIEDGGVLKYITNQQIHDLILYPGSIVQTVYSEYTANTNLTVQIPTDDTVPQSGEGTEILNLSITPRFATSTILVKFVGQWGNSTINSSSAALFRDAEVSAIAAQVDAGDVNSLNARGIFNLVYMDSPATTAVVAYKIRVGPSGAVTMRMNGTSAARLFGGTSRATLVLQEIKV